MNPGNKRRWPNVGSMMVQRLRRWPNIEPHWVNVLCLLGQDGNRDVSTWSLSKHPPLITISSHLISPLQQQSSTIIMAYL